MDSSNPTSSDASPSQSPRASQDMPRTPLSHRLGLLFSFASRPPSPAVVDEIEQGIQRMGLGLKTQDSISNQEPVLKSKTGLVASPVSSPTLPPLRHSPPRMLSRLGKEVELREGSGASLNGTHQRESSDEEKTSAALREALSEDSFDYAHANVALTKPPTAKLHSFDSHHSVPSLQASYSLKHPSLLENLGRSTFPIPPIIETQPQIPAARAPSPPPSLYPFSSLFSNQPNPSRKSIDSLRSLQAQDRALHTSRNTLGFLPETLSRQDTVDSTRSISWWTSKKDRDELLHPDDQAPTSSEEGDKIRGRYRTPKNPIVFCHGLLGFDSISLGTTLVPLQISHWRGITELLEANGAEVLITRVPATSSPEQRALVLAETIEERYQGRSIHLIGHSMGGLDCRYLTSHLQSDKFKVLSVTTIASPHRGSSFADHFLTTIGRQRLPSMLALLDMLPNGGGDGKAFESLTIESMREFNEQTPDVPGVQYFSWGAEFNPGLLDPFRWPHGVVLEKEGPNDGLVSVESSKWGTYLGTLSGVSHLDLVGWVNTARYTWFEWTGRAINFKPGTFYLGIADHIARVVEGQTDPEDPQKDPANEGTDGIAAAKGSTEGIKEDKPEGVD